MSGIRLPPSDFHLVTRHLSLVTSVTFFLLRRYFGREFAIRNSTSAWHGWSSAHQQATSLPRRQWRISRSLKLSGRCCSYNSTAFSAVSVSPFINCEPTTYGFPQTVGRPT